MSECVTIRQSLEYGFFNLPPPMDEGNHSLFCIQFWAVPILFKDAAVPAPSSQNPELILVPVPKFRTLSSSSGTLRWCVARGPTLFEDLNLLFERL